MAYRLEITLKQELPDAEGEGIRQKAKNYFGIEIDRIRTIHVVTIDADLSPDQLSTVQTEVFTNPVTQRSSYAPLDEPFDWNIWVGFRPGVRDNPGATAVEAIEDVLGIDFKAGEAVYTSRRYCVTGRGLSEAQMDRIAGGLLANDIIQQWRITSRAAWHPEEGIGIIIPKVRLDHTPTVTTLPVTSDAVLKTLSDERNLALSAKDIPVIRAYFTDPDTLRERTPVGLSDPTDIELEYLSQARSDHCNHNTFRGLFTAIRLPGKRRWKTICSRPAFRPRPWRSRRKKPGWSRCCGTMQASPGLMMTIIMSLPARPITRRPTWKHTAAPSPESWACTGTRWAPERAPGLLWEATDSAWVPGITRDLKPRLHPRRLLDGVIEGVRDGGNKSGIPTTFGQ